MIKTEDDWANDALDLTKNKEERIQAAFHLENAAGDENLLKLCRGLLTDPSPIVRHEFAFSLGECGHPSLVLPYLEKAVEEDENIFVRHEALLAIGTLGKKESIPFVEKFLADPDPEMRESAEIALLRLRS